MKTRETSRRGSGHGWILLIILVVVVAGGLIWWVTTAGKWFHKSQVTTGPSNGATTNCNSVFIPIPGGRFTMGSNEYGPEEPPHPISIQPFALQSTEVTQAQWQAVMGSNPSQFKGDDLPVEQVSWDDVQEYIRKLNERDPGKGYRLPTEAEWEYACRAGSTGKFCSGDDQGVLGGYAWYSANSVSTTHSVGQKKPNAWGLYDMHGNVWEWCQDTLQNNYNRAPMDGRAWIQSGAANRVCRGGSWCDGAGDCRSSCRLGLGPERRVGYLGFRLARSVQ